MITRYDASLQNFLLHLRIILSFFGVARSYPQQLNEKLSSLDCVKLFRVFFALKPAFFLCFHIPEGEMLIAT